jgi:hypothetical protein
MMDLIALREPVEVYEAATGNGEPLAQRIESGAEMHEWERAALAAYLRGELVPPKRGRGQRTLLHLAAGTKEALKRQRIENSVVKLRFIMGQLRDRRESYGKFQKVLDYVAEQDGLSRHEIESVNNRFNRAEKPKKCPDTAPANGIVRLYQRWLLETGRLPDFPQQVDLWQRLDILHGQPEPRK